jgi:hypothetical protein
MLSLHRATDRSLVRQRGDDDEAVSLVVGRIGNAYVKRALARRAAAAGLRPRACELMNQHIILRMSMIIRM